MFLNLISSLGNIFANLCEYKTTELKTKPNTEIIKDKKNYKKATNIAEKIINISNKYKNYMNSSDKRKLANLIKIFQKYN